MVRACANGTPEESCPGAKGWTITQPQESWRKGVHGLLCVTEAAPSRRRQPQRSRRCVPLAAEGWGAHRVTGMGGREVRGRSSGWLPLDLVGYGDPGPASYPQ